MVKAIHAIPSGKWWTCKIATECNIGARLSATELGGFAGVQWTESKTRRQRNKPNYRQKLCAQRKRANDDEREECALDDTTKKLYPCQ